MSGILKKINKYIIIGSTMLLMFAGKANAGLLKSDTADKTRERAALLGDEAGFNIDQGIGDIVGLIIQAFLGLLGIIFLVLIISAGFNWMTAGGEEEKVRKAKSTISRAIIGLIIIVAAYAITYFVFKYLPGATGSSYY
jgi:amino acid transporter